MYHTRRELLYGRGFEASKNPQTSTAISTDLIVNNPSFVWIFSVLVVWIVCLVERVIDALFENFFWVFWMVGSLWLGFGV